MSLAMLRLLADWLFFGSVVVRRKCGCSESGSGGQDPNQRLRYWVLRRNRLYTISMILLVWLSSRWVVLRITRDLKSSNCLGLGTGARMRSCPVQFWNRMGISCLKMCFVFSVLRKIEIVLVVVDVVFLS